VTPAGRLYSARVALSSPLLARFFAKFFAGLCFRLRTGKKMSKSAALEALRAAHCSPALHV
jgi:hypothetical protein